MKKSYDFTANRHHTELRWIHITIGVSHTACKYEFRRNLRFHDFTAGVYFNFYNNSRNWTSYQRRTLRLLHEQKLVVPAMHRPSAIRECSTLLLDHEKKRNTRY